MICIVDNHDSFTFNLFQCFASFGARTGIVKNDDSRFLNVAQDICSAIVISPGPGVPENSGICESVVKRFFESKPILGVCLGHQIIGKCFGGTVELAPKIAHGKTSVVRHDGSELFLDTPIDFQAMRYHSWILNPDKPIRNFKTCATTIEDNQTLVMGIRHATKPVFGIQFHPESIGTPFGPCLLRRFLNVASRYS